MKSKFITPHIALITALIFAGAATRLLPHPPVPYNFTAIAAIALFAGSKFRNKFLAFLIPVSAMLLSDAIIGFHQSMITVYSCFAFTVFLGIVIRKKQNIFAIASVSFLSSVIFYLVTNFAVWPGNTMYSQDFTGLLSSYAAGIPFFRNEILGDLFYNGILFGGYYLVQSKFSVFASEYSPEN